VSDLAAHLSIGLTVALSVDNLIYCFLGALLGTFIGVLPGLGPVATIAMLLPATFYLAPSGALIMLAGIYYGAQYGGSTTAILLNMPGESASVVTCLDGYAMAQQGRAGEALVVSALASFFAGCVATLLMALAAPELAQLARKFGPPEYFALMLLGIALSVLLASGSTLKAILMIVLGLALGLVGRDVTSGEARFTFGVHELADGIGFVPVAVGMFAIAEVIHNLSTTQRTEAMMRISSLSVSRSTLRAAAPATIRGTFIGSLLGLLPGGGALVASFAAYAFEKWISRTPDRFGKGAVEGVAAPEAANNAGAQTSFIPLLTLGIPPNAVLALMAGAMMMQGIQPGPNVLTERPELFWGLIVSMWFGNLMLVLINLPLVGLWVRMLSLPYSVLYLLIVLLCCVGVYSVNNSPFEVLLTILFAALGIVLYALDCEPAPLILGFILGPLIEEYFRRTMIISDGSFAIFASRPLSLLLLGVVAALAISYVVFARLKKRASSTSGPQD
jgi:putative tricarboxylic transport membrane protein